MEIQGNKANLKYEKRLDKRVKRQCAAGFIQKFWRGYQVRKQVQQEQMIQALKASRKKKGLNLIIDLLTQIFTRITGMDIIGYGL